MRITERQKRFIDYFIQSGNASEAARRAGYRGKNAEATGRKNLKKPAIKKAISEKLEALETERTAKAREILEFLTACMRGELYEEVAVTEGQGAGIQRARKINVQISIHDRLKAAEMLMRRYGMLMADVEIEEKRARIDAMKKGAESEPGAVVIITGENELQE